MLTALGKVFTFLMVILSVAALGVSLWAVADPVYVENPKTKSKEPSYKVKLAELDAEILARKTEEKTEQNALAEVVGRQRDNARPMQANPLNLLGGPPIAVGDARKAITQTKDELNKLLNEWNARQASITTLTADLDIARQGERAAMAEQKRLAEFIDPGANAPNGATAFRAQSAAAFAAKQEAEKRMDSLKPVLVNDTLRLMTLMKMNELLEKREKELGK